MALFDYHIHTARCHHAEGSMEEYVASAMAAGLAEMGFSDHLPMPKPGPSPWNMGLAELPGYVDEVLSLRRKHPSLGIRLSVEADFFPDYVPETRKMLQSAPFDYAIGSVHYLALGPGTTLGGQFAADWCVDSPEELEEWKRHDVDLVYEEYFRQMRLCAQSGLFQVMGHVDVLKKFGSRPSGKPMDDYRKTAEVFRKQGVLVELNTAGLRNPVEEIYPDKAFLEILCQCGVPVTLGSDAHHPRHVAFQLGTAVDWAASAGYTVIHRWAAPGQFEAVPIARLKGTR